jgi:hypothetical protein
MLFRTLVGLALVLTPAFAADAKKLPAPYHTPSASNGPRVVPQPSGVALKVPAGFTVSEFASGFA